MAGAVAAGAAGRAAGAPVPMAEQDRGRWDRVAITEGVALVTDAMVTAPLGPRYLRARAARLDSAPG